MHKAFQYMPDNVKTKYFIQLDADMILKENSILIKNIKYNIKYHIYHQNDWYQIQTESLLSKY